MIYIEYIMGDSDNEWTSHILLKRVNRSNVMLQ